MAVKRILVVYGTRPEIIKLAPVMHRLARMNHIEVLNCSTAQHRQLSDQMLSTFRIKADIDLNVMTPNQSLDQLTSKIITEISTLLDAKQPDLIIVQGDTTTAYAAALAAFYKRIPVAHVEAGLRTYDMDHPFPEEFNRQSIAKIATWHFAPSKGARDNLLKEGIAKDRIWVTGNTSIDALLQASAKKKLPDPPLSDPYILLTAHRRENIGPGMERIAQAIHGICFQHPKIKILAPLHPNPKVRKQFQTRIAPLPNVHLVEPMGYLDFVSAMKHSFFLLSDSGGVQEEAPALGKPVLVLREHTERVEAIEAGTAKLVGTCPKTIISEAGRLITDEEHFKMMANAHNPYGDGRAAKRIVDVLSA